MGFVAAYSGGSAPESHGIPYSTPSRGHQNNCLTQRTFFHGTIYGVFIIKAAMKVKLNYLRGIFSDRLLFLVSVVKKMEIWFGKLFCVTLPSHCFFIDSG